MGMYFWGVILSLALDCRYIIPSDSNERESSRFLIVSERSDARI